MDDSKRDELARNEMTMVIFTPVAIFLGLILLTGLIVIGGERLYVVNGNSYSDLLAEKVFRVSDQSKFSGLESLRTRECSKEPFEIYKKDDGVFVARCGMYMFASKTYIFHFDPFDPVSLGTAKLD